MLQSIKSFFVKENSVRGASLILIVTLALSNVLGVFRDHFLAQKIPTDRLDIYFAAFRLPDLIFNILILGSIAAAFVPVYSRYMREKGQQDATRLAQATITTGMLAVAICLVALFILMPYLMHLLVPNFDPQKKAETVTLARWLLLSPFFFTVSYFIGGVLNAHKRFLAYSIAPLVYNLSIIVAVLLFADKYGVKGAVWGVIAGSILHLLVQVPAAYKVGFNFKFILDLKDAGVRRILRLMAPRAVGLGANQILLVFFTSFASAFPGGIAVYNFADNMQTVPSVIFGNSFALAVFPTLAGLSLKVPEERDQFLQFFHKSFRAILFFIIPATALMIILRAQIIRIILGYGFFGWSDTKAATATLGLFAISIIAQGLIPLLARSFYALHDTRTPMYASIASIILSIVLGFILTRSAPMTASSVSLLAFSFSIGAWVNLFILAIWLSKKLDYSIEDIISFTINVVALTVVMLLVVQAVKILVANIFDIDFVRYLLLQIILSAAAGVGVYLGLAWLFKFDEVRR